MTKIMNTSATLLVCILISALFANRATSMAVGGTRLSISCIDKQETASTLANVPPASDQKIVIGPKEPTPTQPFASVVSTFVGFDCVTGTTSAPAALDTDIIARSISLPIAGSIERKSYSPAIVPAARRACATKNTDCKMHPDTNSSMSNNALSACPPKMNNNKIQEKWKMKKYHNNDFTKIYQQEKTKLMAERKLKAAVVVVKAKRLALAKKGRETIGAVVIHQATDQVHDAINPEICCHCYDEGMYNYTVLFSCWY